MYAHYIYIYKNMTMLLHSYSLSSIGFLTIASVPVRSPSADAKGFGVSPIVRKPCLRLWIKSNVDAISLCIEAHVHWSFLSIKINPKTQRNTRGPLTLKIKSLVVKKMICYVLHLKFHETFLLRVMMSTISEGTRTNILAWDCFGCIEIKNINMYEKNVGTDQKLCKILWGTISNVTKKTPTPHT